MQVHNLATARRLTGNYGSDFDSVLAHVFMSHPCNEAQLLDPAFRATLARPVRLGLEDFLRTP